MGRFTPRPVRVLTVDAHAVFRRAASELIAATDGFEQIGEATSGPEALEIAAATVPDLVLIDLRLPGMDGIETARRLRAEVPEAVLVLTSLNAPSDVPVPEEAGASLHVRKQDLSVRTLTEVWGRGHRSPAAGGAGARR